MDCYSNRLTALPDLLPTTIRRLDCDNNCLTSLPETLPAALTLLHCCTNRLTLLPDTLPSGLRYLECKDNHLIRFPENLPTSLVGLDSAGNYLPIRDSEESIPEYVARVNAIAESASKDRIVQRCGLYFEELAQNVWHPSRVERRMLLGVDMEDM